MTFAKPVARPLGAVALVALLGAATLSCSNDEPEPIMPPTPTASASPPEATSEPSAEPTEPWQEKSFDGAEAFATHWFDVFSEAMPTGDTSEMRAISDPECANCNAFMDVLQGFYEDGGFYRSKGYEVKQATSIKHYPLKNAQVGLSILRHDARAKESATAAVQKESGGTRAYVAELRWTGDSWLMHRFEPVD